MKKVFMALAVLAISLSVFAQSMESDIAKLTARSTLGGKYTASKGIEVLSKAKTASAETAIPAVDFGRITSTDNPNQYIYPLVLKNADDVVSVRVGVDQNPNFASINETLSGNIVRASDRQYNLVNLGAPGIHSMLTELQLKNGAVVKYPGSYTVPPCPESDIFTVAPEDVGGFRIILKALAKSQGAVGSMDFYVVEYYDGKDALANWNPNTDPQPKALTKLHGSLKDGQSTAIVDLMDTHFRGYAFVGWYAAVETTKCGTKVKSDIRDFMTTMPARQQVVSRKASISLQVQHVGHSMVFTATVDSLDKPARIFLTGSGAGIVPNCYFYWQNWDHFIGGEVYFIWPWNKGPQTFQWVYPDDIFWKGAHYTMVAALFVQLDANDYSGKSDYLYDQSSVLVDGSAPVPGWVSTPDCGGGGKG